MKPTALPCEDCGGVVVAGPENVPLGAGPERSEWCTNLECPSNSAFRGFLRIGINEYLCDSCELMISTPLEEVLAHRRAHQVGDR